MSLPEIYKNKIDIPENDNYYRGSAKEQRNDSKEFPKTVKIKYQNKEFFTTIVNMTNNYYITRDGNVLYKKDVTFI